MRKIMFRGKLLNARGLLSAGSWVEGGYYVDYCYGGCPEGKHYIVMWNSAGPGGFTDLLQVDPKTVGQYTGLKDKNGNEIYEGDIAISSGGKYEVVWEDAKARWLMKVIETEYVLIRGHAFPLWQYVQDDGLCKFTIIGNKFDNPELLEV